MRWRFKFIEGKSMLRRGVIYWIVWGVLNAGPVSASPRTDTSYCAAPQRATTTCNAPQSTGASWDFFTNYGNYMPRVHCLRTEEGSSDWTWVLLLIGLNLAVIVGYLKIFIFWRRCYLAEEAQDRNPRLWDLAILFLLCAICGYGMSIIIFFWPAYRLLAVFLVALNFYNWRFALNMRSFESVFTAGRVHRQLNESLQKRNQELENSLQKLEKSNSELERFAYVASHDLSEPLRKISVGCQLLESEYEHQLDDTARQYIDIAVGGTKRMKNLIDDLLLFSRAAQSHYKMSQVDLNEVFATVTHDLEVSIGEKQALVTSDELPTVFGAETQLIQLMQNLIANGIKYQPHDAQPVVHVSCTADDKEWTITVQDNGLGIEPQSLKKIFVVFQRLHHTAEYGGTGIGLSVCERIVARHNGRIWAESDGIRGTTFRFTLPIQTANPILSEDEFADEEAVEAVVC